MRFVTANTYFQDLSAVSPVGDLSTVEKRTSHFWPLGIPKQLPTETFDLVVMVEVNHGNWIIQCPFCPGAQFADEHDHRFLCVNCLHAGTDAEGKWLKIKWPKERERIEQLLDKRPLKLRSWRQGDDLEMENLEHGLDT